MAGLAISLCEISAIQSCMVALPTYVSRNLKWSIYASIVLKQLATLITKDIMYTVDSKFFTMNGLRKISYRIFIV